MEISTFTGKPPMQDNASDLGHCGSALAKLHNLKIFFMKFQLFTQGSNTVVFLKIVFFLLQVFYSKVTEKLLYIALTDIFKILRTLFPAWDACIYGYICIPLNHFCWILNTIVAAIKQNWRDMGDNHLTKPSVLPGKNVLFVQGNLM